MRLQANIYVDEKNDLTLFILIKDPGNPTITRIDRPAKLHTHSAFLIDSGAHQYIIRFGYVFKGIVYSVGISTFLSLEIMEDSYFNYCKLNEVNNCFHKGNLI